MLQLSEEPSPTSLVLWHAGREKFERPTLAGRTVGDNHANSGLGIYCSTVPAHYITGFGKYIYELKIRPDVRVMRMTVKELFSMSSARDSREWFVAKGRELAEDFDIIELEESDGWISQAIILRDDAIIRCQQYETEEFLEKYGHPKTSSPGFARI